jgi:hypothetical protein
MRGVGLLDGQGATDANIGRMIQCELDRRCTHPLTSRGRTRTLIESLTRRYLDRFRHMLHWNGHRPVPESRNGRNNVANLYIKHLADSVCEAT